jgi:tetratricopeptide (TPR) repeat protein
MAPEQRAGREASAASDQYAFAVALFEALSGALPSADSDGRSLPVWLRRPLERALANDPQDRFEAMADLLAALERDPARSRRRWLAAAGGLGLVAASAMTLDRLDPDVEALCSSGAETMARVWSPERRGDLQAALGDGGGAGAATSVAATVSAIDRYAEEWTEQYQSACQATHGLGVQSPTLLDLRVDCLDQRRRELSALVDAMTNRADLSPARAVDAASTLTPLARCADTRALQAPVAPPASEQVAVQVAGLRERLAEVSALERVGDYDRGAAAAGELVTAARALGYWPLTAEALLALGRIEEQASDDAVSDTLARAVDAAVAGGHARVAAEALVRLVRVHAYQRADLEQGRYHGELASAALERVSAPAELEAELADHLGRLAYQEGDLERAQTLHRRAFALRSELDSTSPEMASSALRLAAIEAERGELAEAIRLAEAAVVVYRSAYGEGHPRLAIALANLGNFQYRAGHLDEALERTRQALFIQSRTLGDDNPRTADSRLQEATILLALGRPDEALSRFEHVRSVYERTYGTEHVRTANVLGYIAGVHDARAEHGVAAELFAQALSVQERAYGPDHPWVANTRYNLAVSLKKDGRFGAARSAFESTLRALESQVDDGHVLVSATLTGLGQTLVAAGEPRAAIPHLERALAIREARDADPSLLASTRFALARALVAAGGDGTRAARLAEQAEERYLAVGTSEDAAEVVAWRQRPRRD